MWCTAAAVGAIAAYPLLGGVGRGAIYLSFSWLAIVAVAIGARRAPRPLRLSWRLLLTALIMSAVTSTVNQLPAEPSPWLRGVLAVAPAVESALFLAAAVAVVVVRGRNDFGGLIDTALVAVVLGGVLAHAVVLPRTHAAGRDTGTTLVLAVVVMVLAGTIGAVGRLIETDTTGNRALELLLVALVLNLVGYVLAGGWPPGPIRVAAMMAYLAAYVALGLASIDRGMLRLADPGPPRHDRIGGWRLTFIGTALLTVPVITGVQALSGRPVDGAFLIAAAVLIVATVLLRISVLARDLHTTQDSLRHLADHDPLTGALNRRAFTEVLSRALQARGDCLLVFCDLDQFKQINDAYGHAAGDRLLVDVAARLRRCVREQDAVGRLGGDEFLILFQNTTTAALGISVDEARHRVMAALHDPFTAATTTVAVTASIGTALSSAANRRDLITPETLIAHADMAMYADKDRAKATPPDDHVVAATAEPHAGG